MHWFPRYSTYFPVSTGRFIFADDSMFQIEPPLTIGHWFRMTYPVDAIVGIFGVALTGFHWSTGVWIPGNRFFFQWTDSGAVNRIVQTAVGTTTFSTWHLLVASITYTGGVVAGNMYVDGAVVQDTGFGASDWGAGYGTGFSIGHSRYGGANSGSPFAVSGLFFCNQALGSDEIRHIYKGKLRPQDASGCQGFWPFSEGAGDTIEDVVGGNTGTSGAPANKYWSPNTPDGWRKSA